MSVAILYVSDFKAAHGNFLGGPDNESAETDMGTSGTGRLSDYPGKRGDGRKAGGRKGGGGGKDRCLDDIVEQLEEVARCEYHKKRGEVPKVGTQVKVVQQKRIAVTTVAGETIGYLPTQYNYLAACLAAGFKYRGKVQTSSNTPVPAVVVELSSQ